MVGRLLDTVRGQPRLGPRGCYGPAARPRGGGVEVGVGNPEGVSPNPPSSGDSEGGPLHARPASSKGPPPLPPGTLAQHPGAKRRGPPPTPFGPRAPAARRGE